MGERKKAKVDRVEQRDFLLSAQAVLVGPNLTKGTVAKRLAVDAMALEKRYNTQAGLGCQAAIAGSSLVIMLDCQRFRGARKD